MATPNPMSQGPIMNQHPHYANGRPQGAPIGENIPSRTPGPVSRGGADSQNMQNMRMALPMTGNEDGSSLYELWQFTPKINSDGGRSWKLAKRKFIPSDQKSLEYLVKDMEAEKPIEDQYESLSKVRRDAVDKLVEEHNERDPRYEWTCVYIKTDRRKVRTGLYSQDITLKMEVIISRDVRLDAGLAAGAFGNNNQGPRANPRISGDINGFGGRGIAFQGTNGQNINPHPQVTDNIPRPSRTPGYGGTQLNDSPASTQIHPHIYPQGQQMPNLPANAQVQSHNHPASQPRTSGQVHPQMHHPQMRPQGNPQGHPQGATQIQTPMPLDSYTPRNYQAHTTVHQGIASEPIAGSNRKGNGPSFRGISPGVGQGIRESNDQRRGPIARAPTPPDMDNPHGIEVLREGTIRDLPRRAQKHASATAVAAESRPRVFQKDRQSSRARGSTFIQEDSSSMTEDESLFENQGYSSASSMESTPKRSSHDRRRHVPIDKAMESREHRIHDWKRNQKDRSRTVYPAGTADTYPSVSSSRRHERERLGNTSRQINPVTVHGGYSNFQIPHLSELALNSNETSYRLLKIQEQQRSIIDRLDRLELDPYHDENVDYVGKEMVVRGIEPEMPMLGRRVYYQEPRPVYRRMFSYIP